MSGKVAYNHSELLNFEIQYDWYNNKHSEGEKIQAPDGEYRHYNTDFIRIKINGSKGIFHYDFNAYYQYENYFRINESFKKGKYQRFDDVKAEAPRLVAAHFRGGELCEQIADDRKRAGVGDGVASRGAADRRLINHNHLVDLIDAEQLLVFAGTFLGTMEVTEEGAAQHVVGERALAGTGNAGDAGEQTERDFDVHVLEIVFRRYSLPQA